MSIAHDPTGDGRGPEDARRSQDLAPSPAVQAAPDGQPTEADTSAWVTPGESDPAWEAASDGATAAWDRPAQPGPSAWDAEPEPGPSPWDLDAPAPASTWPDPAPPARPDEVPVVDAPDVDTTARAAPVRGPRSSAAPAPAASDQVAALAERLATIVAASERGPHPSGDVDDSPVAQPQPGGRSDARGYGGSARQDGSTRRAGGTRRTGGGRRRSPASEPPDSGAAGADAEPDHESVARSIALRQLTAAPRSRAQLAEAMAKRDVPEDVADRVLDRFTEVGLVDDAAYAEVLVRSRHAERGLSRRALAMELRRKGVDDAIAQEALAQVDDDDEEQAARALARKKLRTTRGLDREVRLRRAYGALGRKGYGGSLVSRVVREELAAEGVAEDDDWRGATGDD